MLNFYQIRKLRNQECKLTFELVRSVLDLWFWEGYSPLILKHIFVRLPSFKSGFVFNLRWRIPERCFSEVNPALGLHEQTYPSIVGALVNVDEGMRLLDSILEELNVTPMTHFHSLLTSRLRFIRNITLDFAEET